jgi:D-ribose pyranase
VEKVIIAEETKTVSPTMFNSIVESFDETVAIELIPHAEFMKKREGVKAMIRTGEFTAYASVILVSGADLSKWCIENE